MYAHRISSTIERAQSPKVSTANKRSRWICDQCKRQFFGIKPFPFCYRTIITEETTKSKPM